jgi:hypothetical protein
VAPSPFQDEGLDFAAKEVPGGVAHDDGARVGLPISVGGGEVGEGGFVPPDLDDFHLELLEVKIVGELRNDAGGDLREKKEPHAHEDDKDEEEPSGPPQQSTTRGMLGCW